MFDSSIYIHRRKKLLEKMSSGILIFFGNNETPMNYQGNPFPFRQDSNFLYFFGIDEPGLVAVLDADSGEEVIFGDELALDDIIWMGFQESIRSKAEKVGISTVHPSTKLTKYVNNALENKRKIHYLPPYPAERKIKLAELLGTVPGYIDNQVSTEMIQAVSSIRIIKSQEEIREIDETLTHVTHAMFVTAMRMANEGTREHEISGAMEGIALRENLRTAYPIICSVRGEVLHNHIHSNILKANQMLLIDAGAESPLHYATDITRTIPVNRKFTEQQKAVYTLVLDAQLACIEAIKPGVTNRDIHMLAARVITSGLIELGLMKGNAEDIVQSGAHALFFPHGIGHLIGLDVHDMEDLGENNFGYTDEIKRSDQFGTANLRLGRALEEGYVITIEPGIYFIPALFEQWEKQKKFADFIQYAEVKKYLSFGGVRIEDNIAVTSAGYQILGKPIPKTVDELETL